MKKLLIKAGRLFDGVNETPLENQYVLVEGPQIKAIGAQSELEGGIDRFDEIRDLGPDVTLLPGLINMHTHMSFSCGESLFYDYQKDAYETKMIRTMENLKAALKVGLTTIRDCATVNSIAFSVRAAVEEGIMVGPRVFASGAGVTTTGGHCWFCGIEADGELEVRRAVRAQKKAGADFIKVFATGGNATPGTNPLAPQYSKAEMRAVTEEADRLGMRVASHVHGSPGIHTSVAARVTTIEHCSFLTDAGPQYDPEQARIMAGEGIYASPTIFRGPSKFFSLDMKDIPQRFSRFLKQQGFRFEIINKLVDQGVKIVAGSDAGVTFNEFSDYPGDLILFGEGTRLSPAFVLKSATSVAAEALGVTHLGVVAPGKAADLLAVKGNPLENIRCLEDTCLVVSRGEVVAERPV